MERLEDLQLNGLKIYQDDSLYHFTSDAVLLSRFSAVKKGDVVADFCAGSGIVGLHLYGENLGKIKSVTLFEMQKPFSDLSKKTVQHNGLENIFDCQNIKVQDIPSEYNERFSLIVCNPPYMKVEAGDSAEREEIAMCKSEVSLTLDDLIKNVARCLKFGGRVNLVHRADRLIEVVTELKKYNLEPKKLQMVVSGNKPPYVFMIEAVKGGKSGVKVLREISN
ncbi:MAG: hypothetical protein E7369_02855 [Clostridiales bacterium]|nr:hypothetical protein [Clostridiales bacterium]